jgi:hypothetical protein
MSCRKPTVNFRMRLTLAAQVQMDPLKQSVVELDAAVVAGVTPQALVNAALSQPRSWGDLVGKPALQAKGLVLGESDFLDGERWRCSASPRPGKIARISGQTGRPARVRRRRPGLSAHAGRANGGSGSGTAVKANAVLRRFNRHGEPGNLISSHNGIAG